AEATEQPLADAERGDTKEKIRPPPTQRSAQPRREVAPDARPERMVTLAHRVSRGAFAAGHLIGPERYPLDDAPRRDERHARECDRQQRRLAQSGGEDFQHRGAAWLPGGGPPLFRPGQREA